MNFAAGNSGEDGKLPSERILQKIPEQHRCRLAAGTYLVPMANQAPFQRRIPTIRFRELQILTNAPY
jgi:hypothetical protein